MTHEVMLEGAGSGAEDSFSDIWMETGVGDTFDWLDSSWTKLTPQDLWSAENGDWLIVDGESVEEHS